MSAWTSDELDRVAAASELDITPLRTDGTPRAYTTIRVVRVGDELFVRSFRGRERRLVPHGAAISPRSDSCRSAGV
jgi:hypothetical protein